MGVASRGIDIEDAVKSLGVRWIKRVRTYGVATVVKTLREALKTQEEGLKVIIADGECQLARQRRIRPERARLSAAGKHAEARRALEINAFHFPESASVAFELGRVYEALGEMEQAKAQYEKALRLQPEHQGARRRLDALSGG